jgi:hypothetical protein
MVNRDSSNSHAISSLKKLLLRSASQDTHLLQLKAGSCALNTVGSNHL